MSVEEFLCGGLASLDNYVRERVKNASSNGNVLRYVCVIDGSRYSFHSLFRLFDLKAFVDNNSSGVQMLGVPLRHCFFFFFYAQYVELVRIKRTPKLA